MPIERALLEACRRETGIHWRLQTTAVDLLTLSHDSTEPTDRYRPPAVIGAYLLERETGAVRPFLARRRSSPPAASAASTCTRPTRKGRAATASRWRGGPERGFSNLEYIQFHPDRALPSPRAPAPDRGPARRRGADHRRLRPPVPARGAPGRGARPARRRGPRHPPAHARARRAVRSSRHLAQAGGLDPRAVPGADPPRRRVRLRPDGRAGAGRPGRALLVRRRRRGRRRPVDARTPPRGGRGLLHRRPRRQPPRLDVAARGAPLGLAGGEGRRGSRFRERAALRSRGSASGSRRTSPWTPR